MQQTGQDTKRDEDEQQVGVVAEENDPADIGDLHWPADPFPLVLLQLAELATALLAEQRHMLRVAILRRRHAVAVELGVVRLVAP